MLLDKAFLRQQILFLILCMINDKFYELYLLLETDRDHYS